MERLFITAVLFFAGLLFAADVHNEDVSMFPKAKEGYIQYIIRVPKTENDASHKVELLIGKTILVDCNQRSFFGKIKEVNLKGWGYTYLDVTSIEKGVSTMMACPKPREEKFITLHAPKESLRRYNSRLPIVVYVPQGYEVKYRIWSVSKKMEAAKKSNI